MAVSATPLKLGEKPALAAKLREQRQEALVAEVEQAALHDIERRQREIAAAVKSVDLGQGVVIVTDMYGGTPCNLALTLLERGKVEVLAGANLPSLIKLVDIRNRLPLDQAVKDAIEAGRKYMRAGSADLVGGAA